MPAESTASGVRGELLIEIGCEEIPAGFLAGILPVFSERLSAALTGARLEPASVETYGTPRRLIATARAVPPHQPDLEELVVGPPVRAAFGEDGKPTRAAEGFARKNGASVADLTRGEAPGKKGEYVMCTRREAGRPAIEVLPALLGTLIADLPWPKSMRWGWMEDAFPRPVHWIVAKLAGRDVLVQFADVVSGPNTHGHRFLAPQAMAAPATWSGLETVLREAFVVADPRVRRSMIEAELGRIEREVGCKVRPDSELIDEVRDLVEYPVGVCGSFDEAFLEVPEEVIVSAMRSHQRYFAMEDEGGKLVNRFVTISGTIATDPALVRHGNEKVLAARLSDARFFFREDRKKSLDDFAVKLSGVVFQAKLGTIADKVARLRAVAIRLAGAVGADPDVVARVADLCKADLVTHMVGEFPDLQGVMGTHYARLAGEPDEVADAIAEHYLPRGASDALPASKVGAIIGLADRLDTIVGCFAAGLAPTGSADPYGLRRAAVGSLAILLDRDWSVSLRELVAWAASEVESQLVVPEALQAEVREFFRTRLRGLIGGQGEAAMPVDCIEAALAAGSDDVPDASRRARAVAQLRERADFEPLAAAFKRVANIIKDQDTGGDPDPAVFVESDEKALWKSFGEIEGRARSHLEDGDYESALRVLAELKAPVDRFFDSVLVMDENESVRKNRLAMLGRINATFARIADFRQLAV